MNILIVDDDELSRELLAIAVKRCGHSYQMFENAYEAANHLASADLLLMDWEMPDKSGVDFVKEARSHGVKIPIIIITVKDSYQDMHEAMCAGANQFVSKPINVNELIARINLAEKELTE
ncbi:MAG TPA: response regulator [Methylophaga aminisulfidivorans]|uniref:Response regulator n=2 Tax=root TaxID=1 RepID=A0A7C1ZPT1_9GAMM|nr:response regulator [Methylophaga aminisulfidivorans]